MEEQRVLLVTVPNTKMHWKWTPLALRLLAVVAAREYGFKTYSARSARSRTEGPFSYSFQYSAEQNLFFS